MKVRKAGSRFCPRAMRFLETMRRRRLPMSATGLPPRDACGSFRAMAGTAISSW